MREPEILLLESVLHFLDRDLAASFLRRARVLSALVLGELANEGEIAALELAGGKLAGRDRGSRLTAALRTRAGASAGAGRAGIGGRGRGSATASRTARLAAATRAARAAF